MRISIAENAVTVAQESELVSLQNLLARIGSAVVLAPVTLYIVWVGGVTFFLFLMVLVCRVTYEWDRLNGGSGTRLSSIVLATFTVGTLTIGDQFGYPIALLVVAIALLVQVVLARYERGSMMPGAVGTIYIVLPFLSLLWLRSIPLDGRGIVVWLLLTVWFTDILGYFVGNVLAGPKLAPNISPRKTWSGFFGGLVGAALVGGLVHSFLMPSEVFGFWAGGYLLGALIGVSAQGGDLGESWLKRRNMVKDSGNLIPGHGGLLDRIDGLITGTPLLAFFVFLAS